MLSSLSPVSPSPVFAASGELNTNLWTTNGDIRTIVPSDDGNTIYIGGDFTRVGPYTGGGASLNATTGEINTPNPTVNGYVLSVISDGAGGWYLGGYFTQIGTSLRNNIAHILPDKTVDPEFNPSCDGPIYSLAIDADTLYVGGGFTSIGGKNRNSIAAIDIVNNEVTYWNPDSSGYVAWDPDAFSYVLSLAVTENLVYVGGTFTSIGGEERNNIAALDKNTGEATNWNPNASDEVRSLVIEGEIIYVGGWFNHIGGEWRNYIAALNTNNNNATGWNPNASDNVSTLIVKDDNIYAGGDFTSIGGEERNYIAELDLETGDATEWNPDANGAIDSLQISDDTVYVGGSFTSVGGEKRNSIAELDLETGDATEWNPDADHIVLSIALSENSIYAGGYFSYIGGLTRNKLAAINSITGEPTDWNPNVDGAWSSVCALTVSQDSVYIGGSFDSIGGQARKNIAVLDKTSGQPIPWDPIANQRVLALAINNNTLYVGGEFTSIGGQNRKGVAALDKTTGLATDWNPNFGDLNPIIFTLSILEDIIYVGGYFSFIDDQPKFRLASLYLDTGLSTDWNPNVNHNYIGNPDSVYYVSSLATSNDVIYVGGHFSTVGGEIRNNIAAINKLSGEPTLWNPDAGGEWNPVYSLNITGNTMFVGGGFTNIGSKNRNKLAALDVDTGETTDWDPNISNGNSYILSLATTGDTLYVGGRFTSISGISRSNLAAFSFDFTAPLISLDPLANSTLSNRQPSFTGIATDEKGTVSLVEYQVDSTEDSWSACEATDGEFDSSQEEFTCSVGTDLTDGEHTIYVRATDNEGNTTQEGDEEFLEFTIDATAPSISSISTTNHTITWNTDKPSSSMVEYGVNTHYGSVTKEFDTNPRVNSHAVELANLLTCTNYNYRVISVDSAGNSTISEDNSFTTLGCTGNAEILTQDKDDIPTETGGTLALSNTEGEGGETTLLLTVPSGFLPNEAVTANFQAKRLNSALVAKQAPLPKAYSRQVGYHTYDLRALVDTTNYINEFDKPLTITLSYTDEQVKGISPHDLAIHRFDGTTWHMLESTVDTGSKTVTASTRLFSIFALLAKSEKEEASRSSSSHSSSSHPKAPTCSDPKPSSIPDLFQIDVSARSAKLYFTPISNTSRFFISFAENPRAEAHGELVSLAREGVQSHSIYHLQPNTTYYVKVRGQKGCMPGDWSNIMMIKTPAVSSNRVSKYYRYLY